MTDYSISPEHRKWIVGALLVLLMNQSYFLGGYVRPEDWDSLPSLFIFCLGGLASAFLIIELLRFFLPTIALWTHARQLKMTPLLALPVLAAQGGLLLAVEQSRTVAVFG